MKQLLILLVLAQSFALTAFGRASEPERAAGERLVLRLSGVDVAFRWIPPGRFTMGSPLEEDRRWGNEEEHIVEFTHGFWLAETETTRELWNAVNQSEQELTADEARLPVASVSWFQCRDFVNRLNSTRDAAPAGYRFALPSEAQWEYSCRAGTTTPFHFGASSNGQESNVQGTAPYGAQEKGPYLAHVAQVGSYAPNAWGLYDMHGNLWEWTNDWFGGYDLSCEVALDPAGPEQGKDRVIRGGAFGSYPHRSRSAARSYADQGECVGYIGVRLALLPENMEQ